MTGRLSDIDDTAPDLAVVVLFVAALAIAAALVVGAFFVAMWVLS